MTLKQVIAMTYTYYSRGQVASDDLVEMYAGDLADLDQRACVEAYNRYRRNPANKQMPLPAQIRELVNPEEFVSAEAQAREIAARIVGAITSYGWNNGRAAEAYIGPIGWEAVRRAGGWSYLCQNTGVTLNPLTLQAQLRDSIEGTIRYGSTAIDNVVRLGERSERKGELVSPAEMLQRLIAKRNNEPEGNKGGA